MKNNKIITKSIVFYIFAILFAFLLTGLQFLLKIRNSIFLPQLAPLISAIICLLIFERNTFLNFFTEMFSFDIKKRFWYLILSLFPVIPVLFAFIIFNTLYEPITINADFDSNFIVYLLWAFVGAVAEEIGWRGYLIRQVEKKTSPFNTSVIIGIAWAFWHVYFLFNGIYFIIAFVGNITLFSFLYSYLYFKTNKSVICPALAHFTANVAAYFFVMNIQNNYRFWFLMAIPYLIFSILFVIIDRKMLFTSP